jgi:PAS domain S-box-containing protein
MSNEPVTALLDNDLDHELLENSVYGIFRFSLDGSFLRANSVLLEILACPSLHVLQSMNLSADVFRFPEHYVKLLASCRQNGMVQSFETEWRRRDGGFIAVKLHLRYLPDSGGPPQLEGIVEDVTELRALEHQLRQAQKFETIGELAYGIAHDFNNVIGAILGWAELGLEESQSSSMADSFTFTASSAMAASSVFTCPP